MGGRQTPITVSVAPFLDMSSINISLQEAVQTSADIKVPEKVDVEYRNDKPVYAVSGYAEELLLGFEVKNFRSVTVDAANGEVISVYKEGPILSFIRALVVGALKSWGFK